MGKWQRTSQPLRLPILTVFGNSNTNLDKLVFGNPVENSILINCFLGCCRNTAWGERSERGKHRHLCPSQVGLYGGRMWTWSEVWVGEPALCSVKTEMSQPS